ncbi:hypothetical protein ACFQ0Q_12210 [Streptomyces aureus]
MDIRSLGFLRIETAKLAEWRTYVIDILGMTEGADSTDNWCLRCQIMNLSVLSLNFLVERVITA